MKIHLYNTETTAVKYIASHYSSQEFLPNRKHNLPDDSQLRRYKPVLDESAPDLILARRKYHWSRYNHHTQDAARDRYLRYAVWAFSIFSY